MSVLGPRVTFWPQNEHTHSLLSLSLFLFLSPLLRHVAPGRMFAILDSQALKAKGGGKGHNRHRAGSLQAKGADLAPLPLSPPSVPVSLLHATREFIHVEMRKFVINALCLMLCLRPGIAYSPLFQPVSPSLSLSPLLCLFCSFVFS